MSVNPPRFDPELEPALAVLHEDHSPGMSASMIAGQRRRLAAESPSLELLARDGAFRVWERTVRAELAERFPEMWSRVTARRGYMAEQLGIELAPEVLPFSERQATLPAGLLSPDHVVRPA